LVGRQESIELKRVSISPTPVTVLKAAKLFAYCYRCNLAVINEASAITVEVINELTVIRKNKGKEIMTKRIAK
jgi:hypothetical protein